MAGRGFKGHIAVCSTTLLLIQNLIVLAGGVASVVILLLINHEPVRAGWLIVIAGGFTIASGLIGLCSSTRRGCFTLQLVLLAFSVIGLFATAFAIFFRPKEVRSALGDSKTLTYDAATTVTLLKVLSAVMFVTGCVQIMVLTLGICVNCCDLNDYYEDIEMTRTMNAKEAKEAEKRAARREDSKAAQLSEQMKEKYGKWTDKGDKAAAKK